MFGFNRIKELKKELEQTKAALDKAKEELIHKQDVINKTNAYWKKQMHIEKNRKKKV